MPRACRAAEHKDILRLVEREARGQLHWRPASFDMALRAKLRMRFERSAALASCAYAILHLPHSELAPKAHVEERTAPMPAIGT
jgi:hypothetical protein